MEKELYNDDDFYEEEFDEEAEAKERYPFLFDEEETGSVTEYERTEIESVKITTSTGLVSQNRRPNYHHLHALTDDLLPTLDFIGMTICFRPVRRARCLRRKTILKNRKRCSGIIGGRAR